MGLMQVMPSTYATLRRRYNLGDDPYDPQNNIMAGAAYIREMYDRFGSPNFLAAYNAGPDRVDAFLAGGRLPNETATYLAQVSPRLGDTVAEAGSYTVPADASRADPHVPAWSHAPRVTLASAYAPQREPEISAELTPMPVMRPVLATLVTQPVQRLPSGPGNWAVEVGNFQRCRVVTPGYAGNSGGDGKRACGCAVGVYSRNAGWRHAVSCQSWSG